MRDHSYPDFKASVFAALFQSLGSASTLYLRLKRRKKVRLGSAEAICTEAEVQQAESWTESGSAPAQGAGMVSVPVKRHRQELAAVDEICGVVRTRFPTAGTVERTSGGQVRLRGEQGSEFLIGNLLPGYFSLAAVTFQHPIRH
jgi:hypothetical protein